jgi:cytochrome c oxidase subunit 3
MKIHRHLFHLVDRSPWPLFSSIAVLFITMGFALYIHRIENGFLIFFFGLLLLIVVLIVWWRDVIRESTHQGNHTLVVQRGLRIGFMLFIASEIMFFAGFFRAYFHSSLVPSIELGAVWPPVNIVPLSPWSIPMLNTAILLVSGFSITWVHFALIYGHTIQVVYAFIVTLVLAITFTGLQINEYFNAPFNISDSVFGSTFFALTGLHGLHVIIGTIFISVCFGRFLLAHFTRKHHLGFEFASWYWHFVDVVWLFLYVFVYIWGSW